jgi:hypothetical protein
MSISSISVPHPVTIVLQIAFFFSCCRKAILILFGGMPILNMFLQLWLLDSALKVLEADLAFDGFGSLILVPRAS